MEFLYLPGNESRNISNLALFRHTEKLLSTPFPYPPNKKGFELKIKSPVSKYGGMNCWKRSSAVPLTPLAADCIKRSTPTTAPLSDLF
ncbi:hypothetical protein NPIL_203991 [Nephila pilipes]|uniref:Uncharacterized protein n=1 Tax=Nephila pilipes TaxID=299642 RepID=A0A8X6P825_NEPPI|nr:hypothetical protein NPIL_203991 [Nephila pilipes]